jgi:hypothetical protein
VNQQLVALRAERKTSPSGVNGQILRLNLLPEGPQCWQPPPWRLPAMMAALMAPIETPDTQLGSTPASWMA